MLTVAAGTAVLVFGLNRRGLGKALTTEFGLLQIGVVVGSSRIHESDRSARPIGSEYEWNGYAVCRSAGALKFRFMAGVFINSVPAGNGASLRAAPSDRKQ
ncbi:hypothetical protein GT755_29205 [Herbidospora sp. NEAU-GS84]|uniref:Uncharacterized protein n=1 Tax=Herbidospora solisilvae TaxID=2696284 RepID=A0A7C9J6A4_9ACTN|nr:hypothetical protein [Herbidospora solisilvae]NAS25746.1 hypothetical protein [Herbidospora solisilvae]